MDDQTKQQETAGLSVTATKTYEDAGCTVYQAGKTQRVVNHPDGYRLDMPADWEPDFSMATVRSRFHSDDVTLTVTNEDRVYGVYGSVEKYLEEILQFIRKPEFLEANRVEKLQEQTLELDDRRVYLLKMHLCECPEGMKGYYTYAIAYNDGSRCTQMTFKCVDDRDFAPVYNSLTLMKPVGKAKKEAPYPCVESPYWNEETRELYRSLRDRDTVCWGLFEANLNNPVITEKFAKMEKALDFRFPIVSSYTEMDWDFPTKEAQGVYDDGRIFQYTYHTSNWPATLHMGGYSNLLDVYRGLKDDEITRMARQIAAYGKPMLFRVNNEMNSTWTIWSAHECLLDPDIFTEGWERIYDIFTREGANQYCIWIWNPQGYESCPVANWNEIRTYMPDPRCVDMLGLTSYNFGKPHYWYEFESLYQHDTDYYGQWFGDWAWILSEFGCSDTHRPSRKAGWIRRMFDCYEQKMFPNIKAAIWFDCNDEADDGSIINQIELAESEDILCAFREGLKRSQK